MSETPRSQNASGNSFLHRLIYTKEGHVDFSWLMALLLVFVGCFAFLFELVSGHHASISGWAFLGAAFSAVLVAAVPIAKARLLANATMPQGVAKAMSEIKEMESSSDIQEIIEKLAKPDNPALPEKG